MGPSDYRIASGTALVRTQTLWGSGAFRELRRPSGGPGCTSSRIPFPWDRGRVRTALPGGGSVCMSAEAAHRRVSALSRVGNVSLPCFLLYSPFLDFLDGWESLLLGLMLELHVWPLGTYSREKCNAQNRNTSCCNSRNSSFLPFQV